MAAEPDQAVAPAQPAAPEGNVPAEMSKKAAKKAAKEAAKAAAKEARERQAAEQKAAAAAQEAPYVPPVLTPEAYEAGVKADLPDSPAAEVEAAGSEAALFGDTPLFMSRSDLHRGYTSLQRSLEEHLGKRIWVRARVHTVRGTAKSCFLLLRDREEFIQACGFVGGKVSKDLIKYVNGLSKESVVEVCGKLESVPAPIKAASPLHQQVEIHIEKIYCTSRAAVPLPLQVEDAMRADSAYEAAESEAAGGQAPFVRPGRDTRLDNRFIDLRTPANQAIFKIRARVASAFREFLTAEGFTEIWTPKIIPGSSEGGSAVFPLDYFGRPACLAQSPQLYKQMAIAGGMKRVFEVGPVFRAENSHTHRHLCEFTGLDIEMEIDEHYHEVIHLLGRLMRHIFTTLDRDCVAEIATVRKQFDITCPPDLVWAEETVIVPYSEGIRMLQAAGFPDAKETEDLSTELERALGHLVKEKYNTDFYILDKFPASVRPFYTMPDPQNPTFSNSFDMFIRGEEITSGAQRIHEPAKLREVIATKDVDPASLEDYVRSFAYGCPPHGGAGIGLERVVMLFLGLDNCRQCCLFPRTPERLTP